MVRQFPRTDASPTCTSAGASPSNCLFLHRKRQKIRKEKHKKQNTLQSISLFLALFLGFLNFLKYRFLASYEKQKNTNATLRLRLPYF